MKRRQLKVFQLSSRGFLLTRVSHIKLGGLFVIFRKATNLLQLILAALPLLLVRALRPVLLIRFSHLPTQTIGSLAIYPELYLCKRDENGGSPVGPYRPVMSGAWLAHFRGVGIDDGYGIVQGKRACQGGDLGVDKRFCNLTLGSTVVAP